MECSALGTLPAERLEAFKELLVGLSGLPGEEVYLHELVMRSCTPGRPELHLQHRMRRLGEAGRWRAAEYRVPLQGRAAVDLPATVRSVVRTQCRGPDVLAFWQALGFGVQRQMLKQGLQFEVEHAGHAVQVLVCTVLRLPQGAHELESGEELVPGHWLVEATTAVEGGAYAEAAAALGSLSKLLSPYTVLQPMPAARGRPKPAS